MSRLSRVTTVADRFSLKSLLIILVLLLIPIVFLLRLSQHGQTAEAAWYNDAWMYRQQINVATHSVGETNVYIITSINIGTTTHALASDTDFRFTDNKGLILPYYIASGAGTTAVTFHIQLPSFPAGASTYYAYYGNPSASSGASASDFATQASNYSIGSYGSEETGGGPVAYWKFDEGVGNSVFDSSPSQNSGSFGTGSSYPSWATEDQCVSGKCIYIPSTHKIATTKNLNLPSQFTVSQWVRTSASNGQAYSIINTGSADGFRFGLSGGKIGFLVGTNGSNYNETTCGSTLVNDNKWHHIVGVYKSGDKFYCYIDGKFEASVSIVNFTGIPNYPATIGGYETAQAYTGYLDETKIYPYARTLAQILSDYNSGKSHTSTAHGSAVNMGSSNKNSDAFSNGLVGYWKFDEPSYNGTPGEVIDSSGNNNNGVGISGVTTAGGKYGLGASFDGVNDRIDINNIPVNTAAGTYNTVTFWMYANGYSHSFPMEFTNGYRLWYSSSNCLGFNIGQGDDYGFDPSSFINKWVHVAAIFYNGAYTGKNQIYVDGVAQNLTQCAGAAQSGTANNAISIGGMRGDATSYRFNGQEDDFRIYNRALQPSEITALYNWAPGPVGYWKFDEGTGTTAYDSSGNNNNGLWQGTLGSQWTQGKYGGAGIFNGINNNLTLGNNPNFNFTNQNFTIESWINITPPLDGSAVTNYEIISNESYTNYGYIFRINNGSASDRARIYFRCSQSGAAQSAYSDIALFSSKTWHHVAAVRNGTTARVYLDGKDVTIYSDSFVNPASAPGPVVIGGNGQIFYGKLDDLRVYSYTRTQSQIIQDMNAGHPLGGSPVGSQVGYWKFDEGYGTVTQNWGNGGIGLSLAFVGGTSPTWTNNGRFGKAITFNGLNNDIEMATDNDALDPLTGSLTVSTWINAQPTSGIHDFIVRKGTGGSTDIGYALLVSENTGKARVYINDGSSYIVNALTGNITIADGTWHYVVFTWDPAVGVKIYVDGNLDVQQSVTTAVSLNSPMALVIGGAGGGSSDFTVNGSIDEVKIYHAALSADDIKLDYNQGKALQMGSLSSADTGNTAPSAAASQEYCVPGDSTSCAPPIARWDFTENTGTTAFDTSGNGLHAPLGPGSSAPTWASGKIGTALSFNGTSNSLYLGSNSSLSPNNLTVETWFNTSSSGNSMLIRNRGGGYGLELGSYTGGGATGKIKFWIYDTGASYDRTVSSATYNDGKWHFAAGTYNGSQVALYIDGVNVGSSTAGTIFYSGNNFAIGKDGDAASGYYSGSLDQIKIFGYARTPAQIAWDYDQGKPIAWYKFDECQGNIAYDWSTTYTGGVGNTGLITIGAGGSQTSLGTCAIGNTATAWSNGANGKWNSSLNFDGTDDYINIGATYWGNQMSISLWTKSTNTGFSPALNIGDSNSGVAINSYGAGYIGVVYNNQDWIYTNVIPTAGVWYHIVLVKDTNLANPYKNKIYINGSEATYIYRGTPTGFTPTTNSTTIGRSNGSSAGYFSGQIDDVRIYNYALTPEQIKQVYNNGAAVNYAPITGTP